MFLRTKEPKDGQQASEAGRGQDSSSLGASEGTSLLTHLFRPSSLQTEASALLSLAPTRGHVVTAALGTEKCLRWLFFRLLLDLTLTFSLVIVTTLLFLQVKCYLKI